MRKLIAEMKPVKKALAKQLVSTILAAYFIIAIAVTGSQLFYDFYHEKENQHLKIDSLIRNFEGSFSSALWNYDEEQVKALVDGLGNNEEILGVAIVGGDDFSYQVGEVGELKPNSQVHSFSKTYTQYYAIRSPDQPQEIIGTLYVFSGFETVFARAYTTFLVSLLAASLKTFALWLIAVRVINRFVGKPISALQQEVINLDIEEAKDISASENDASQNTSSSDENELDRLKVCFQALFNELRNQNYIINNQTASLERLVNAKTTELQSTIEQLRQANSIKTNFLANISHELRTPLNAIIGFSRRLARNSNTEKVGSEHEEKNKEIYAIILRNSEALLDLINKMLDMSRISGGNISLDKKRVEIGGLIESAVEQVKSKLKDKSLNLELAITPNLYVEADPERLIQLIHNLVSNAIKFTNDGSIAISTSSEVHNDVAGCTISFLDTGVGIAENELPMLFQHFQKLGDENLNTVPGTGLGLAIVYELVKLHGGEIRVDSILGKGSLFQVWLPESSGEKPA
ncbi:HAMP domain-containing sensor histidine kinase [Aurantivibrio plasticivorans]